MPIETLPTTQLQNMVFDPIKLKIYQPYKIHFQNGIWKVVKTDQNVIELIQVDLHISFEKKFAENLEYVPVGDNVVFDLESMQVFKPYKVHTKNETWKIVRTDACAIEIIKINQSSEEFFRLPLAPIKGGKN